MLQDDVQEPGGKKNKEEPENTPKDEGTLIEEAVAKVRKAMAYVSRQELALEEVQVEFKKSKYNNKTLSAELSEHRKTLADKHQSAKKALLQGNKGLEPLKALLVSMAAACKAASNSMAKAKDLCKDTDNASVASKASKKTKK